MSRHPDLCSLIDRAESSDSGRRSVLDHVRQCARCRADLAERDPSLLFALLAVEPIPAGVLERVSTRTEAAIERDSSRFVSARVAAWASLAASFVVAGLLGAYLWSQTGPTAPPTARGSVADVVQPPQPDAAIPAGMIELLESPGKADVVEMTVGEVEVVMIFDEAMEI